MKSTIVPILAILVWVISVGCAEPIKGRYYPAFDQRESLKRLAVVPLAIDRAATLANPNLTLGGRMVARHLAEAFEASGVDVIPAEDVSRLLIAEQRNRSDEITTKLLSRLVSDQFGADVILIGQMRRYVERGGEAVGSRSPASVAFDVALHAAPGGQLLWSAMFDETQKALMENVFLASRYPGGGTRWLTASELARWGAVETVRLSPLVQ